MGLAHILEENIKQIADAAGLKISLVKSPGVAKLDYKTELMLYRVLQELMNNTIKHAQASEIQFKMETSGSDYVLTYTDNGKGFDQSEMKNNGLGLRNLESRVKMIGGSYSLVTSPRNGVRVEIRVPLR